jgi:DNA-binding transcriptional regulator YhcF (GntR family)
MGMNDEQGLSLQNRTKYQIIIADMKEKIAGKEIRPGDLLPSINEISDRYRVAKETGVKAYRHLKQAGLIDSIPGKGFFLISDQISDSPRVMMILNSFNSNMQTLYQAYMDHTPSDIRTDIYFHNNNIDVLKNLIDSYSGRYTHHIVKPPEHRAVPALLGKLEKNNLLLLDRDEYRDQVRHFVCQDFSRGFSGILGEIKEEILSYEGLYLIRSRSNPHPQATFDAFGEFLDEAKIRGEILPCCGEGEILRNRGYILNSDEDMVRLLQIFKSRGWEPGRDGGFIVYNESPILEFIGEGISSISVDFAEMGTLASRFIREHQETRITLKPCLIRRGSF